MIRALIEPSDQHPITVQPFVGRVTVSRGGAIIADAVIVTEANYPPVYYIPRGDVSRARLEVSKTETWCPYKGAASHMNLIDDDGARIEDAAWSYIAPAPAVAAIADRLAFYPDKVDAVTARPA